jgi:hypothetical protein
MKKTRFKRKTEAFRKSFFLFGLVVALAASYTALSYTSARMLELPEHEVAEVIDDVIIPITKPTAEKPPERKKQEVKQAITTAYSDVFISVDDFMEVEDFGEDPLEEVNSHHEEADNEIYHLTSLDRKPIYNGCEGLDTEEERYACFQESLRDYVTDNFRHGNNPFGEKEKVLVHFVIDKEGNVQNVETARGSKSDRDQLEKLIKKLPPFVPAMYKGKYVRTSYVLPVVLRN